jgi:hypothetical protein
MLRPLAGIVALFIGLNLTIWMGLAVLFVLYDARSKADPAARVRAFFLFSALVLVGVGLIGVGAFLAAQGASHLWEAMRGH